MINTRTATGPTFDKLLNRFGVDVTLEDASVIRGIYMETEEQVDGGRQNGGPRWQTRRRLWVQTESIGTLARGQAVHIGAVTLVVGNTLPLMWPDLADGTPVPGWTDVVLNHAA